MGSKIGLKAVTVAYNLVYVLYSTVNGPATPNFAA
jgi:hypothetical protein